MLQENECMYSKEKEADLLLKKDMLVRLRHERELT